MLKIREHPVNRRIYVFDDGAQPNGTRFQYWWNASERKMNQFTMDAKFVSMLQPLRDLAQVEVTRKNYSDWLALNFSTFVSEETKYWEKINRPPPAKNTSYYTGDSDEHDERPYLDPADEEKYWSRYNDTFDPADMPTNWDGYGDTGENCGVDYD